MKKIKTLSIITLILTLVFVLFSNLFLYLFSFISFNLDGLTVFYSNLPYYFLVIVVLIIITYSIVYYIKNKKIYFDIFSLIVVILFICTFIFVTPFRWLYTDSNDGYSYQYYYGHLFFETCFTKDSDENLSGGDYADKYIYIPFVKKMIEFDNYRVYVYDIKYLDNNYVEIDNVKYKAE